MNPRRVYLVAEDSLGLALGRRLLREGPGLEVFRDANARGSGALRRDVHRYNAMALNGIPVVMLTDLDRSPCPAALIDRWLGARAPRHPEFLLRVCVREAEAWVLADPGPIAGLLELRTDAIPREPEKLADPKAELLRLAERAPSAVRRRLRPRPGSRAIIGPDYNEDLAILIEERWDPAEAARRAPSLQRARHRIDELRRNRLGTA